MICDNWHTATCMKYCSTNITKGLKNWAQKISHMLLKLNKDLLSTEGVSLMGVTPVTALWTSSQCGRGVPLIKFRYQLFYSIISNDSCLI